MAHTDGPLLPEDDFSLTENELRAELARFRREVTETKPVEIHKLSPEEALMRMTLKALGLQHEVRIERDRTDTWRKLANGYEDIRAWLRNCPDNQEGHSEFYKQACLVVFGVYRDDEFDDDRDEVTGETR